MPGVADDHHPGDLRCGVAGTVDHVVFDLVGAIHLDIHRVDHLDVLRQVAVNVVTRLRPKIDVRLLEFLLEDGIADQRDHGRNPVHDDHPANQLLGPVSAGVRHVVQHHVIAGSGRVHLVVHLDAPGQVPLERIRCRRPRIRIVPAHLDLDFPGTHQGHLRPLGVPHRDNPLALDRLIPARVGNIVRDGVFAGTPGIDRVVHQHGGGQVPVGCIGRHHARIGVALAGLDEDICIALHLKQRRRRVSHDNLADRLGRAVVAQVADIVSYDVIPRLGQALRQAHRNVTRQLAVHRVNRNGPRIHINITCLDMDNRLPKQRQDGRRAVPHHHLTDDLKRRVSVQVRNIETNRVAARLGGVHVACHYHKLGHIPVQVIRGNRAQIRVGGSLDGGHLAPADQLDDRRHEILDDDHPRHWFPGVA